MRTNPEQYNPYDEPQEGVWCSEHGRWECDEHGYDDDLDKTEATCQWFDELEARRNKEDLSGGKQAAVAQAAGQHAPINGEVPLAQDLQGEQAGGSDLCVHIPADSPAPLLLHYPVWEKSFHEHGWGI